MFEEIEKMFKGIDEASLEHAKANPTWGIQDQLMREVILLRRFIYRLPTTEENKKHVESFLKSLDS